MLSISEAQLAKSYLWYEGVEVGPYRKNYLRAVNLARGRTHREVAEGQVVEWRVSEDEFLRWLAYHRLYIYDPTSPEEGSLTVLPRNEQRGTMVDIILVEDQPPLAGTEEA